MLDFCDSCLIPLSELFAVATWKFLGFWWLWLVTFLPSHFCPFGKVFWPLVTLVCYLSNLPLSEFFLGFYPEVFRFFVTLACYLATLPLSPLCVMSRSYSPRLVTLSSGQWQDLGHRLIAFIHYLGTNWAFVIIRTLTCSTTLWANILQWDLR